jgi:hypothetical protein
MVCLVFGPFFATLALGLVALSPVFVILDLIVRKEADPVAMIGDMLIMVITSFKEVYRGEL